MRLTAVEDTVEHPVAELDLTALRAERDGLRDQEAALSYRRRILQGQLDILRADGTRGGDDLTIVLSEGDDAPSGGPVRAMDVRAPEDVEVAGLPDLTTLDADGIVALTTRLETEEQQVSADRRLVLARLDELQDELVRRYRDDGVDVGGLVGER